MNRKTDLRSPPIRDFRPVTWAVRGGGDNERYGFHVRLRLLFASAAETERRLEHPEGAEQFYRELRARGVEARIGFEASGPILGSAR